MRVLRVSLLLNHIFAAMLSDVRFDAHATPDRSRERRGARDATPFAAAQMRGGG